MMHNELKCMLHGVPVYVSVRRVTLQKCTDKITNYDLASPEE